MTTLYQTCDRFERFGDQGERMKTGSRLGSLGRFMTKRAAELRRDLLIRREIAALDALSDHILHDVGIPRSRIPDVARANVERYLERKRSETRAE